MFMLDPFFQSQSDRYSQYSDDSEEEVLSHIHELKFHPLFLQQPQETPQLKETLGQELSNNKELISEGDGKSTETEQPEKPSVNPALLVPTIGRFYMHEDRTIQRGGRGRGRGRGGRGTWEPEMPMWTHDKFESEISQVSTPPVLRMLC